MSTETQSPRRLPQLSGPAHQYGMSTTAPHLRLVLTITWAIIWLPMAQGCSTNNAAGLAIPGAPAPLVAPELPPLPAEIPKADQMRVVLQRLAHCDQMGSRCQARLDAQATMCSEWGQAITRVHTAECGEQMAQAAVDSGGWRWWHVIGIASGAAVFGAIVGLLAGFQSGPVVIR